MWITVCLPGWIEVCVGFNKGSIMLEYVLSACLSLVEKKKKLSTSRLLSKMALFLWRKSNPNNGLVSLLMTMKRSLKKISPTFNWCSTVAVSSSKYPFATIFSISGGGLSFKIVCDASIRILKWRLLVHPCQSGHQWLVLRNPTGIRTSTFCFSTESLSIMVGSLCFFQGLIGVEGRFLYLWPVFGILWNQVVFWKLVVVKCWEALV